MSFGQTSPGSRQDTALKRILHGSSPRIRKRRKDSSGDVAE